MAKGGLKGVEIFVKSLDIDDSTDEAFDTQNGTVAPVVDPFGKLGDDNLPDYRDTNGPGQFWNGTQWAANILHKKFDETGMARFDLRIGMQPGNNYRVVGSVGDNSAYTDVQVYFHEESTYLGPELDQDGSTIASEPLTVWRRLWVENDSMQVITEQGGIKRNDLHASLTNPTINDRILLGGVNTRFYLPDPDDITSFLDLQKGHILIEGVSRPVLVTARELDVNFNIFHSAVVAGDHTGIPIGTTFHLYDDDDLGLNAPPLPRLDLVNEQMKKYFRTSFIEVKDANPYNPRKLIGFRVNESVSSIFTTVDSARDLSDANSLWVAPLTAAYQEFAGRIKIRQATMKAFLRERLHHTVLTTIRRFLSKYAGKFTAMVSGVQIPQRLQIPGDSSLNGLWQ